MGSFLLATGAVVLMFAVVIGIHELGHFATAKWSGIRVDEFAIGFGPRVLSRSRGETVYSVRALPLGGFVKMPGMSTLEEDDGGPRGFVHARLWKRLVVLVAGVAMNFLLAGLLFGVQRTQGFDSSVSPNLPAAAAHLVSGDEIVAAQGQSIDTSQENAVADVLHAVTDATQGAPISVSYLPRAGGGPQTVSISPALAVVDLDDSQPVSSRDGTRAVEFIVTSVDGRPVGTGDPAALLGSGHPVHVTGHVFGRPQNDPGAAVDTTLSGAATGRQTLGRVMAAWYIGYGGARHGQALPGAILTGFTTLPSEVGAQFKGVWDVFTTPNSGGIKNFQGAVGIAHDAGSVVSSGWMSYFGLVALISMSLGIVNILPIPPLDGGRVALVLTEAVRRRRIAPKVELGLAAVGGVMLAALIVVITINDIRNF